MKTVTLLPFLLFTAACLTTSHSKYLTDYASPYREFDTGIAGGNFRVTEGRVVRGDHLTARFSGILAGKERILQVEQRGSDLVFSEVSEVFTQGDAAFLIQQNVCCLDDQAFRAVLFAKEGDALRSSEILSKYFKYAPRDAAALIVMDFANVYTISSQMLCWNTAEKVACTASLAPQPYTQAMQEIRWDVRSRFVYGFSHAWYLIALPVDIVTFPFQVAGLFLYGKGAVR